LRRGSEPRASGERHSTQKLGCRKALLAFELNFEKFLPGVLGAGDKKTVVFDVNLAGSGDSGGAGLARV